MEAAVDPELEALLSQMDPETLKQLLGMGTLDERGQLLQQQMAQAEALRQPQGGNYSSVGGAIGGGIGDVLRGLGGGLAQAGLGEQQQALLGQKDMGRNAYVEALRQRRQSGVVPGSAGMGDLSSAMGSYGLG